MVRIFSASSRPFIPRVPGQARGPLSAPPDPGPRPSAEQASILLGQLASANSAPEVFGLTPSGTVRRGTALPGDPDHAPSRSDACRLGEALQLQEMHVHVALQSASAWKSLSFTGRRLVVPSACASSIVSRR